jgi:predicted PurR-regulated permease PerM
VTPRGDATPDGNGTGDEPTRNPPPEPAAASPDLQIVDLDGRTVLAMLASIFVLVVLAAFAREASRTLTWLAVGSLLALALNPVVLRVEQRLDVGRGLAVGVVLTMFLAVFTGVTVLLGPRVVDQARSFNHELPRVLHRLEDLPVVGGNIRKNHVPQKIKDWIDNLPQRLGNNPKRVADAGKSVLSGALAAFAVVLITVTLLLDGSRVVRGLRRAVPYRRRALVDRVGTTFYEVVGRYFAGSLVVALLNGTGILVVGTILGVPLTPAAAIWATVTNLIPQIGGFLGGFLFVALALTKSPTTALICLVYFLAYQQLENHVIQPVIVGEAVNLSPPTTMLAALVGASAAGVPGALLATPLVGVIKAIYLEVRNPDREPAPAPESGRGLVRLWRRWRREREPPT